VLQEKQKNITNIILFQVGWWSTAFLCASGYELLALGIQMIVVGVHFWKTALPKEWKFILSVSLIGFSLDSFLVYFKILKIDTVLEGMIPHPWLLGLWVMFATTLKHSLNWILNLKILAIFSGVLLGPLTYHLAGEKFKILGFEEPLYINLLIYAVLWGALMGVILKLNKVMMKDIK
jgi:hypothetical protein